MKLKFALIIAGTICSAISAYAEDKPWCIYPVTPKSSGFNCYFPPEQSRLRMENNLKCRDQAIHDAGLDLPENQQLTGREATQRLSPEDKAKLNACLAANSKDEWQ